MGNGSRCSLVRVVWMTMALLWGSLVPHARAQERPAPTVDLSAGWVGFADDGIVSEGLVGAAARFYLSPRVSVGPELLYLNGPNHSHLVLTGNVTWDLLASPDRVVPFVVAGAGLFQTRESFPIGSFTSSEGAFTAGGGIRVRASDRVLVGIDTRIGWELHVRVNGVVSVRLGR